MISLEIDQYLLDEGLRIIDAYGHHPSFCMMAAGNEPAGDWMPYCQNWVKTMREYDPNRIYCAACVGGGWTWEEGSDYHVKSGARGLDWDKRAPHSDDDYYQLLQYPVNYKKEERCQISTVTWISYAKMGLQMNVSSSK